jgi:manganese transport protein
MFSGSGLLVAVGYMDPGNWATDIAGGSSYGYKLLFAIFFSNGIAILLQSLAVRLGIVTGRDLAQACRDNYSRWTATVLWILAEISITACDLAEVMGAAIALQLLFRLKLIWGVCLSALDVLLILALQQRGLRFIEAFVAVLVLTIAVCFAVEIYWAQPNWGSIAGGLVPPPELFHDQRMFYLSLGILGATVMPHNLYLHSSLVKTRRFERTAEGKREAIRYNLVDTVVALSAAFFVNASILVMAAAVFHRAGLTNVTEIQVAYKLLSPLLGTSVAAVLFAVALLCAGQSATLTGVMAGQIVMEGFVNLHLKPWKRRLLTRLVAIVPAILVIAYYGEDESGGLLVLSQVILSLQLSFAVFPLVSFTSNPRLMGEFVNSRVVRYAAWAVAILIAALNGWLLLSALF